MTTTFTKTVAALLGGTVLAAVAVATAQGADYVPPPAEPAGWLFAFTPRVWYVWQNDFYFQKDNVTFQQSNEAADFPFAGGSFSVTPAIGGPTYSLTVLYGEGSSHVIGAGQADRQIVFGDLTFDVVAGRQYNASVDVSRLDIEGIAQIPIAEGVNAIVGGRYINFKRDEKGEFIERFPIPGLTAPPPTVCTPDANPLFTDCATPAKFNLEQAFYLGELGFGVQRPVNDTGSIILFGNVTSMFGVADVKETTGDFGVFNVPTDALDGAVVGVDTNAGAAIKLSDNILASARYRLFYLSAPGVEFNDGGTFIHGPEVNLTFTFGG